MRLTITLCAILCMLPAPTRAASPEEVGSSIQRAVEYLYTRQRNGNWEVVDKRDPEGKAWDEDGGQWGGLTAVATYALLAAGENPQDPRIVQAVDFLKAAPMDGVYGIAMRCQVWLHLPQTPEIKQLMSKDANLLLKGIKGGQSSARGMYDYILDPAGDNYSHSRSQYGVLGIWAAAQSGFAVPRNYWTEVERAWISHQDASGGWTYKALRETEHPLTPGMTAVGVATLYITQDYLRQGEGGPNPTEEAIEKGMQWIISNFKSVATDDRFPRDYPYATLYAIERIGVASGRKYFGDIDWYDKGADWLISSQKRNGSWSTALPSIGAVADTSFGILFLTRGRAPVVMNKLQYTIKPAQPNAKETDANWNARSRDAANISRWIGKQLERDLNWQVVNLSVPVEELHDAPILYISGNQPLAFDEASEAKLKMFVEQGGMIIANADRAANNFANAFRALGEKLFPAYKFRELPETHPIYTDQQFPRTGWQTKPSVLALSNGVREMMIVFPRNDPARAWQLTPTGPANESLYQLGGDIFLYAVDKQNLRYKGQSHIVPDPGEANAASRTIRIARLQYDGNWDPEPQGWKQLDRRMRTGNSAALDVHAVKLPGPIGTDFKVAHLTGTDAVTFDEASSKAIADYVKAGGTLIVDAAGGSSAFADAMDSALRKIFPEASAKLDATLPADHEMYKADGKDLEKVDYRSYARRNGVGQLDSPRLRGMEIDGRLAVIFSAEDLSAGLVGQPVDGIKGYAPDSASLLMTKALLFADR